MKMLSDQPWPHDPISKSRLSDDIFMVTGAMLLQHGDIIRHHSRNMVIIREGNNLTLINTVRLSDDELKELDHLGKVVNIVRIGAFHGRDDAFYCKRYPNACLWAPPGIEDEHGAIVDKVLSVEGEQPLSACQTYVFGNAPEGRQEAVLCYQKHEGILITCDSVKNWQQAGDHYFTTESKMLYAQEGHLGQAALSPIWLAACHACKEDFMPILSFDFLHLLPAHGDALLHDAKSVLEKSIAGLSERAQLK